MTAAKRRAVKPVSGELTDMQTAFLDAYLESMSLGRPNMYASAKAAGYSEAVARNARADILDSPHVQAELDRRLADTEKEGARTIKRAIPTALNALIQIAEQGTDDRARVNAARELLDRTGLIRREGKDVTQGMSEEAKAQMTALLSEAVRANLSAADADRLMAWFEERVGVET
jgi:phage terminase small subunit